ncbi:hypothetical protein PINS_up012553 [Pythium insidiosum]|nr:hypothetical protein PINS_up012553 [Pythium insidiosum]
MGEALNSVATVMNVTGGCSNNSISILNRKSNSSGALDAFWSDALSLDLSGPEHDALCAAVSLVDEIVMEDGADNCVFLGFDEDWGLTVPKSPTYSKYGVAGSPCSIEFLPFDEDDTLFSIKFEPVVVQSPVQTTSVAPQGRKRKLGQSMMPASKRPETAKPAASSSRRLSSRPPTDYDFKPKGRNRRREEILFLRDHVVELQQKLHNLEASSDAADNEKDESMWRQIATKEKEQRDEAEAENARLRLAVEQHADILRQLQLQQTETIILEGLDVVL